MNNTNLQSRYSDLTIPVFRDIIAPSFKDEVQDVVTWKHRWKKISNWVEGIAHVVLSVATILSFSAGFFDDKYLSFAAASCNALCLSMLRFSEYANKESKERNNTLTHLLSIIGISSIPERMNLENNSNIASNNESNI